MRSKIALFVAIGAGLACGGPGEEVPSAPERAAPDRTSPGGLEIEPIGDFGSTDCGYNCDNPVVGVVARLNCQDQLFMRIDGSERTLGLTERKPNKKLVYADDRYTVRIRPEGEMWSFSIREEGGGTVETGYVCQEL